MTFMNIHIYIYIYINFMNIYLSIYLSSLEQVAAKIGLQVNAQKTE